MNRKRASLLAHLRHLKGSTSRALAFCVHFAQLLRPYVSYWIRNRVTRIQKPVILSGQTIPVTAIFINLKNRKDRLHHISKELERVGILGKRFEAFHHEIGELGCALSHFGVLSSYGQSTELIMVLEDDIKFTVKGDSLRRLVEEFAANPGIDVLCIAHVSRAPFVRVSPALSLSVDTQTTAGYLIKPSAIGKLAKSFAKSSINLGRGKSAAKWAIDIRWKRLQKTQLVFAVPNDVIAIQIASFSDIQKKKVSY